MGLNALDTVDVIEVMENFIEQGRPPEDIRDKLGHKLFDSSFFKDHDFVTIENYRTGEIYAVDPTIHDYLPIGYVTINI